MIENFRSGFIAVIGRPNVGKSTITNRLVGEKVAIVSQKPQTTRNRIMGVINGDQYQMVLMDTPGMHPAKNALDDFMESSIRGALQAVDGVLCVIDAGLGIKPQDELALKRAQEAKKALVAINKSDRTSAAGAEALQAQIAEDYQLEAIACSAKTGENMEQLRAHLVGFLPEGPQYFPPDAVTDMPEEFLTAEIIREKALQHLSEEVPHGVGVGLERFFQREDEIIEVHAILYCERDSHKGIIIGKGGSMLKRISSDARQELEMIFGAQVFLRVFVKVKKDWRNSASVLRELGYR